MHLENLRCEYKVNPIGIDATEPRLSWQVVSDVRGTVQSAYQVQVAESQVALEIGGLLWDSGKVASDASTHRAYAGPALESGQHCTWRVRTWDGNDQPSEWSKSAFWEMGLLEQSDWQASWIRPDIQEDTSTSQPCPMLRATFAVDGVVRTARAYVTALGLYEMELNGGRVGDEVFTPGWTAYDKRLQYQTYDVGDLLVDGENVVGVVLGDGWYRGYLGFGGQRNVYGEKLALLLQVRIAYEDGRVQTVCSDETWKSTTGPILASDIYNGERYDARLEKPGWSRAGYDDGGWTGVQLVEQDKGILVAPAGPPVRKIQEVKPVDVLHSPAGETVVDMGQNMVGWVRLKVQGEAGTTVTLRHAEVLQDGNLYTENIRAAKQTVAYTLKGGDPEIYEPRFTFQGFRYVAVEGYPGELTLDSLTGVVVHSDITPLGHFECDDPLLNQLQHNIVWGQKGNYLDVPTDCPQRDERLGWTGDAQVFVRTGCFNMDVAGFFTKWLRDLAADQAEDGSVPHVIPNCIGRRRSRMSGGGAAWADASVICPWTVYLCYGDTRILEEQYESMQAWVGYMKDKAGEDRLWATGFQFGDWLAYATTRSDYPGATTDKDLIATAFFAYSTALLQQTAQVLGKGEDAEHYAGLLAEIKEAFCKEYVTENGRLASNTQTAYALALWFDLLPEGLRPEAARRLAQDVRNFNNHLTTGFVGTPYLCHTLSSNGYLDVAYDLLKQDSYPSWLYPITQGATTIWERWDGIKPDGTFQDAEMNSFNHYAYGAIGSWLYQVVAGIEVDASAPGYKHTLIQPQPGGGLSRVSAALNTMYGLVQSAWDLGEDGISLEVIIPANTHATVRLPDASLNQVRESGHPLAKAEGVTHAEQDGQAVIVEVGSGQYRFAYPAENLFAQLQKARRLSSYTPLNKLRANETAWEVLNKHLPEIAEIPEMWLNRAIASGATLRQAAQGMFAVFTPERLDVLDEELAQLCASGG